MSGDDLILFCHRNIQDIADDMSVLNRDRQDAIKFYRADEDIVKVVEGLSKATTTDLHDTVEWVKPSLLEIFAAGSEVVRYEPVEKSDVKTAKLQDILVNHQITVKNKWFVFLHDWITDALLLKTGVAKYQWYKHYEFIDRFYPDLTGIQFQSKAEMANAQVLDMVQNPETGLIDANIRFHIHDEYPLIEAVNPEMFGFPIKSVRDIQQAPFVYHKLKYEKWEFVKLYGKAALQKVDLAKKHIENEQFVQYERIRDLGGMNFLFDEDDKKYIVYECYYYDEDDGVPYIVDICGDEIVKEKRKNRYRKPPFHVITPIKRPHLVAGYSFYDILKDLQRFRTAMYRSVASNIYKINRPRNFGDPTKVNMDDYLNENAPNAFIRTKGLPGGVIMPEQIAPMPPEVFSFMEFLKTEKDYHTGVPRAFLGVNPKVLNKTWRGQNEQVSQATQRITMLARMIAEMGVAPLLKDIASLNAMFLKKTTSIRYLGEWLDIPPDDIVGNFDCVVNVGLGTGNKEKTVVEMQQLLGIYGNLMGTGVVSEQNIFYAVKELVKAMGHKNTGDFVTDPQISQIVKDLYMAMSTNGTPDYQGIYGMMQQLLQILGINPEELQQQAQQNVGQPAGPEQPAQPPLPASIRGNYG